MTCGLSTFWRGGKRLFKGHGDNLIHFAPICLDVCREQEPDRTSQSQFATTADQDLQNAAMANVSSAHNYVTEAHNAGIDLMKTLHSVEVGKLFTQSDQDDKVGASFQTFDLGISVVKFWRG